MLSTNLCRTGDWEMSFEIEQGNLLLNGTFWANKDTDMRTRFRCDAKVLNCLELAAGGGPGTYLELGSKWNQDTVSMLDEDGILKFCRDYLYEIPIETKSTASWYW